VVVLGMGGSAIGGDLVRSLFSSKKKIIFVSRDYDLPAFVDEKTLVIASSYSGNTEETLSAFSQALQKKCKKLVMTTGGRLKELAEDAKVPVFLIDYVGQPRAALGYSFMPLIAFLQNLGLIEDKRSEVEAMIQGLDKVLVELKETVTTSPRWPIAGRHRLTRTAKPGLSMKLFLSSITTLWSATSSPKSWHPEYM
jgi:glucose/mannose-6-phosphate isomerase